MIEYNFISIDSFSASLFACIDGRTLKPIMMASDALARVTSLSVMAPTPLCITLITISSVLNFCNESLKASTEPSTSPLIITFSSLKFPSASLRPISSSVICFLALMPCSRNSCPRLFAIALASDSFPKTLNVSPACGAPFNPRIRTGVDGGAVSTRWLRSLYMAFTLPKYCPDTIISPCFNVPFCTRIVATKPLPLSSDASITVPLGCLSGFAFNSSMSVSSNIFSSSRSTFKPLFALISWLWYFPPQLSTRMFIVESCSLIFSGFAPSLSILLIANIIGTFAACE